MDLSDLLELYTGESVVKQQRLAERLGEHEWSYNLDSGLLTFETDGGETLETPAQLLGIESRDQLFRWAWTDPSLPEAITDAARVLRHELGEIEGIAAFLEPQFDPAAHGLTANAVAAIACGILQADFFYRGTHDDGALYLLVVS